MLIVKGGVLYCISVNGGLWLMVDVGDEVNVFIFGYSMLVYINVFGKVVIVDVNDYYCNLVKIDIIQLLEDVEVIFFIVQVILMEGVIGYCCMEVFSGKKVMVSICLCDGGMLFFGVEVYNSCQ